MNTIDKIVNIMRWTIREGEESGDVFAREGAKLEWLAGLENVIDVVHAGGLRQYAELLNDISSLNDLTSKLRKVCYEPVTSPFLSSKETKNFFKPLLQFENYCSTLNRRGGFADTCEMVAEAAWHGKLSRKLLQQRCNEMFNVTKDIDKYNAAAGKIKQIWYFNDTDISALNYFVQQCRSDDFNPSQNKALYFFGSQKQTGKTTLAHAIATVLNADEFNNFGKYESSFAKEMGFNDHDLPLACQWNCVTLDEAMPKDSKKSYGNVKAMFTSKSFNYNPKFRQVVTIPAKRNYILTSNDDIKDFIQDNKERRFYAINFNRKPLQLSFDDIYDIIKDFCINAQPPNDITLQEWYDSFPFFSGVAEKAMEEAMSEILHNYDYFSFLKDYSVSVKNIADKLYKNEPTREQKKAVEEALEVLGAERYANKRYNVKKILDIITRRMESEGVKVDDDDKPF